MCACAVQLFPVVGEYSNQSQLCWYHVTSVFIATININRELSKFTICVVLSERFTCCKLKMEAKKPNTDFQTEGAHSEETYRHVLAEGEDDYDDYTVQELEMFPELGFKNRRWKRW